MTPRAEAAAQQLIGSMQATNGLNLVLIDAHEIANFNSKHPLWPTWHKIARQLTDEVGDANTSLYIEAADESMIDEAFEKARDFSFWRRRRPRCAAEVVRAMGPGAAKKGPTVAKDFSPKRAIE